MVISSVFWYFLVQNFHKNQLFSKNDFTFNLHFSRRFFWGINDKNLFFLRFFSSKGPSLYVYIYIYIHIPTRAKYRLCKDAEVLAETPLDGGSENAWFLQISVCRYIGTMGIFSVSCECPWTLVTSSGQFQVGFSWVLLHIPFSFWKTSHFSCTKDVLYTSASFAMHEMHKLFAFP